MGKCKKRTLNKPSFETKLNREDAILYIVQQVKKDKLDRKCRDYISLFGITSEELTEAGAAYEEVKFLRRYMIEL